LSFFAPLPGLLVTPGGGEERLAPLFDDPLVDPLVDPSLLVDPLAEVDRVVRSSEFWLLMYFMTSVFDRSLVPSGL